MASKLVLFALSCALLFVGTLAQSQALFGDFSSTMSKPGSAPNAYGHCVWDHNSGTWLRDFASQWDIFGGGSAAPFAAAPNVGNTDFYASNNGQYFIRDATNQRIMRYQNRTSAALPSGGWLDFRLGRQNDLYTLTLNGSSTNPPVFPQSFAVSKDGNTLWVCGQFGTINGQFVNTNRKGLYEITSLEAVQNGWRVADITPTQDAAGPDCTTFMSLSDRLFIRNGGGTWSLRSTSGTWEQAVANLGARIQLIREGPTSARTIYILSPDVLTFTSGSTGPSTYTNNVIQQYNGGGSWSVVVSANDLLTTDRIADFAVGQDRSNTPYIFYTFTASSQGGNNSNAIDYNRAYHLYVSTGAGGSPRIVAPNWQIGATPAIRRPGPLTNEGNVALVWDPNYTVGGANGALMLYGPSVNYILYGNVNDLINTDGGNVQNIYNIAGYIRTYAKPVGKIATLTWSFTGNPADDSGAAYAPAYGGGLSAPPRTPWPATFTTGVNGQPQTVFVGSGINFCYDTYTGPVTFNNNGVLGQSWLTTSGQMRFDYDPAIASAVPTAGAAQGVYTVLLFQNSGMLVGGYFRTVAQAGTTVNSLMWIDAPNVRSADWPNGLQLGSGLDVGVRTSGVFNNPWEPYSPGVVYAAAWLNKFLYVGGSFNVAGGSSASCVARYQPATNTWTDLYGGINPSGVVHTIFVWKGDVYFGGAFSRCGLNDACRNIARWSPNDQAWYTLAQGTAGTVRKIFEWQGFLIAIGEFTATSGMGQAAGVAAWDGGSWHPLQEIRGLRTKTPPCQWNPPVCPNTKSYADAYPRDNRVYFLDTAGQVDFYDMEYPGWAYNVLSGYTASATAHTYPFQPTIRDQFDSLDNGQLRVWNAQWADQAVANQFELNLGDNRDAIHAQYDNRRDTGGPIIVGVTGYTNSAASFTASFVLVAFVVFFAMF